MQNQTHLAAGAIDTPLDFERRVRYDVEHSAVIRPYLSRNTPMTTKEKAKAAIAAYPPMATLSS